MKQNTVIQACLLIAALSSCAKESSSPFTPGENGLVPIVFQAEGFKASVDTKATPVTDLGSFGIICTKGSAGSETSVWSITSVSKTGAYFYTGKYWPVTNPNYNFYASNVNMNFNPSGSVIIPADMNTDIVYANCMNATHNNTNKLTFLHIFSRIGAVTITAPDGYTVDNLNVSITPKVVDGVNTTFNMRTGNWSNPVNGTAQTICNTTASTVNNDLWLIPGSYTATATYTLTKGEWTDSFTKTTSVNMPLGGKVYNLSGSLPSGSATDIRFEVSVKSWEDASISLSIQ